MIGLRRKLGSFDNKSIRKTGIISLLLSLSIFLLAGFVFTTALAQFKNETSNGLVLTPATGIIQRIDVAGQNSLHPIIPHSNSKLYVLWQDNSSGSNEIHFTESQNKGVTFQGIKNLSNNTGNSEFPQISAAGDNVYVVWQDNR